MTRASKSDPDLVVAIQVVEDGRYEVTEPGCALIRKLAADGLSNDAIAGELRINRKTLRELRRRDERVEEAIALGRAALDRKVTDRLLAIGMAGEPGEVSMPQVTSLIWLSKNRLGWRDQPAVEIGTANLVIQLPSPSPSLDAYRELIEATAAPAALEEPTDE